MSIPGALRTSELKVTTAAQAAACDRAAIDSGTPSFSLMLAAGTATASLLLRDYSDRLHSGVVLFAGTGNNGGDAYVVAAQLARAGVGVRLVATGAPRSADAIRAAELMAEIAGIGAETLEPEGLSHSGNEELVVDGLLGTGHAGPLREDVRAACQIIARYRARCATVVSIDVPTGVDSTSGDVARGAVRADCTVCYGTIKRGVLFQRGFSGRVVLADIGLGAGSTVHSGAGDEPWSLTGREQAAALIPSIAWNAHKGGRGRVLLAGGDMGMAGAVVLAAKSALLSGAGVVHCLVETQSVGAVQAACGAALAHRWPALEGLMPDSSAAARSGHDRSSVSMSATPVGIMRDDIAVDALAVGPGLGRSRRSGRLLQYLMKTHHKLPAVVDADALWHVSDLSQALGTDPPTLLHHWTREMPRDGKGSANVVCTPHAGEFARLLGGILPDDWSARSDALQQFANKAGLTVLLKGTPTLVASAGNRPISVVPHGTALLASGGSGDCLSGIIAVLLAQGLSAHDAAVLGATVHGVAAEIATARAGMVRGTTLEDMLMSLPDAWRTLSRCAVHEPYVLEELPALA